VAAGSAARGDLLEDAGARRLPRGFGPVAVLSRFRDFDAALAQVNDSAYGLQAGIFTRDLYKAQQAWNQLEVGGVVIGDVPSWRVDHMPYGGVKESGLGREGVRFAIEEMMEIR
jgi:acyl-CoA reductase-like NAD-dependent aldehyde dehydrogenase